MTSKSPMLYIFLLLACAAMAWLFLKPSFAKTPSDLFDDPAVVKLADAAAKGRVADIKALISSGANVNASGRDGITPLLYAISQQNYNGTEALLLNGADPNMKSADGDSPVTLVAAGTDTKWLSLLLKHRGDPDAVNSIGEPALVNAALHRNMPAIRVLLEHGADIEKTSEGGDTVLLTLARLNQFHYAYELLERGANALHTSSVSDDSAADYIFDSELDPANELYRWQMKCRSFLQERGITKAP